MCMGRLDFPQVCDGPALINRFGTGPCRQFVGPEMEPFCSSVILRSRRGVKHLRHGRTEMADGSSTHGMAEPEMTEHGEL
jgi:hypothetical protein